MQIILLFVAFFTATAFAEHHHVAHPQRFHHRRALNATSDDADPSTTLTISVTSVRTVLGCPTTKTDCPLATHPISIVTDIIAVYTTVCPLTDAQSISASVASSGTLVAHTSPTVEVPLSTGALAAVSGAGSSSTADATLTYVLGTGTSKVTITTTIKNYKTKTDYVTKYVTKPSPSATVSGAAIVVGQQAAVTLSAASASGTPSVGDSMEPTTTITTTSTTTKTKTITLHSQTPSPTASGNLPGYSAQNSAAIVKAITSVNSNAAVTSTQAVGECPSQITVTIALSTVTVTYSAMGVANTAALLIASNDPISTGTSQVVSVSPSPTSQFMSNDPIATHPIVSYHGGPYGNGTVTTKMKPPCGSSGFLTQSRVMPTGKPNGTGYLQSVTSALPTEMATPTGYY